MVDLLRRGATLTELSCPACSSPIFRLRSGELWCAQCQKRVIVERQAETASPLLFDTLEVTILSKIQEVEGTIKSENDLERIHLLNNILSTLLENLERIRRMKRERS